MRARPLVRGSARGEALVLEAPLSLWGGLDVEDGTVCDRLHPQVGERVTGKVLVMPGGRGSSSSSTILAETIRLETAPAAIVLRDPDPILVVGALVANELYGRALPIVVLPEPDYAVLSTGSTVTVSDDGTVLA